MPGQTKLSVSYSVGVKANLGNYESADVHLSRSEEWDVTGESAEQIEQLYEDRYAALNAQLSEFAMKEYEEMKS